MSTTPDATGAGELDRRRHERESADRLYNEALTRLDGAIQRLRRMPPPPAPYDDSRLGALNERWDLLSARPAAGGWLKRLRDRLVWGIVGPIVERQQAFNSALVDHLNRNRAAHRELVETTAALLALVREELERLIDFQSALVRFAQQITPYVDTRDRYVAALPTSLAAAISALSDQMQVHWESMAARERRYDAQMTDVRGTLAVVQRAVQTLRRELEQGMAAPAGAAPPAAVPAAPAPTAGGRQVDSYKYVAFEDQFRGSPRDIRERLSAYLPAFEGARDVLDVGCGRGEFLDLLRERGIPARGVDLNDEMAAVARDRGLDATAGDALAYLLAQPDGSLGGLFSAQVVEHLEPTYLMRLLDAAYHKLRPGSTIILETINAACWYAFFSSYIRDFTHVRPLHPDTLRYLLVASGFQQVDIRYSAPFPDESKLQPIPAAIVGAIAPDESAARAVRDAAAIVNENMGRLNALLFTFLDYAVVGKRL